MAFNELGEWGKGRAELDEFIRRVPSEPWSHYHRATSRHNLGDLDGAVADFNVAIELNPDAPLFYGERAMSLAMRGEPGRALADVEKALKSTPDHRGYPAPAGLGSRPPRRLSGCPGRLHSGVRRCALDVIKLADRASVEALAGHHKVAEADFESAVRLDPSNAWVRARRALYLHTARGDHKQAVADCDEALRQSPGHAEVSLNRGLALWALGEFRSAIADFDLALDPRQKHVMTFVGRFSIRFPELHRARAEARRRLGDLDGALVDLDAALFLDPDDTEALVRRGNLYATRREFPRTIADFDKAIALGRGDAGIYKARGDARAAGGDEAGARSDRERSDQLRAKDGSP